MLDQTRTAVGGLFSLAVANLRPENLRFRFQRASEVLTSDTRTARDALEPLTLYIRCIARKNNRTNLWNVQLQEDQEYWPSPSACRTKTYRREIIGKGLERDKAVALFAENGVKIARKNDNGSLSEPEQNL